MSEQTDAPKGDAVKTGNHDGPPEGLENATQILRAWADEGQLIVEMNQVWEEPRFWGMFLVDIARHVATSYAETDGRDPNEILDEVIDMFEEELNNPSDEQEEETVN